MREKPRRLASAIKISRIGIRAVFSSRNGRSAADSARRAPRPSTRMTHCEAITSVVSVSAKLSWLCPHRSGAKDRADRSLRSGDGMTASGGLQAPRLLGGRHGSRLGGEQPAAASCWGRGVAPDDPLERGPDCFAPSHPEKAAIHPRRRRLKSRKISRAALCPGAPVTPPPGWLPAPHKYSPGIGPR